MNAPGPNEALLKDGPGGPWLRFRRPCRLLVTHDLRQVPSLLEEAEAAAEEGLWAAGFVAYEAAPAFDPALATRPPGPLPLLWLGLYAPPERVELEPSVAGGYELGPLVPSLPRSRFERAFREVREHIAAGDSYQVNLTFSLEGELRGDPWGLFVDLQHAQQAGYGAYLDTGRFAVAGASPELFFHRTGDRITACPMKGTAPRGADPHEDRRRARRLASSPKERAENVMVVDMIRNDLGRVARPGTVRADPLCRVERYPTVLQMTSTVTARTDATTAALFAALFPCASITGAPKVATTEIIARLEEGPRGLYTGAVGYLAPRRRSSWCVAIRTAVIDREAGRVSYGVGSGVVWDSRATAEHRECLLKARILSDRAPGFRLLETFLWTPDEGYFLLAEHLERLAAAADRFGFTTPERVEEQLGAFASSLAPRRSKVRLLVDREGGVELEAEELAGPVPDVPVRLGLAAEAVSSADPFLRFKTTWRRAYEKALASRPGCDDVLLWNERRELTESVWANVLLRLDGELVTPPVASGLLPGTFRRRLLAEGRVRERVVRLEELPRAREILLANSVRGLRRAVLVEGGGERAMGGQEAVRSTAGAAPHSPEGIWRT